MIFKTHVVHYDHGFVFIREWRPPTVLGVIHLFHGMMEHSGMYHTWATKLTAMGWAVVAHDHAGAGYTVHRDCRRDALPTNGKDCLIDVARVARRFIHQHYPNQPVVAYGHSMGALMVMSAINHLPPTAGVILTGSTYEPQWLLALKSAALRFFLLFTNALSPALLAHVITFAPLVWAIKPRTSEVDWVSRNPTVLKHYMADAMCGNVSSWGYFYTLTQLLRGMMDGVLSYQQRLLVLTGSKDPLSNGGKALLGCLKKREANQLPVEHVVLAGAHHKVEDDIDDAKVLTQIEGFLAKL